MKNPSWAATLIVLCCAISARGDEAMIKAQERYQAGLELYRANKHQEALKEFVRVLP